MNFFIDKILCCFGIEQNDKKSEEIFNKISFAMNKPKENDSKPKENISLENLNLGQSDPTGIPETLEISEIRKIYEISEIPETHEIVNKTPKSEFYYEEDYSSLVLTNSDEYENFSRIICGFFYTVSFIIIINIFVIQRQFLIKNYFK
jgi:hypothetical protein